MSDATQLVKVIKRAAVEAVLAGKPAGISFGVVDSVSPLSIKVDQKLSLDEDQLVLTKNVSDFVTETSVPGLRSARTGITIHNGLAAGDQVILLRVQGGQKFIVLDRLV